VLFDSCFVSYGLMRARFNCSAVCHARGFE
jgi:hypothetical protein